MAGPSPITAPDLKEVIAAVAAWVAALVLTLSNDVLRADQALALGAVVPILGWAAMHTYTFRHVFAPTPSQADGREESPDGQGSSDAAESSEDGAPSGWGIHRYWLLGIVTPVIIVILLSIGYGPSELAGPDLRAPAPVVVLVLMAVASWVGGLLAFVALVAPGGLIVSGLRPDMGARRARIFGGVWAYVVVAFAVAGAQAGVGPTFGRPGWLGEGLRILLGFGDEPVSSPGWLWAARVLFVMALVVMPLIGALLLARSKREREPQDATSA